ncbi:histidine kinase [Streptomyces olivaceoviridis]|uniref:HAMP domain-containing histidine kinase n=1 Tax=Streptomyces olivaceoviridis TaxID=1921 RepID=UPI001671B28E|nr:HAMP domain-containing histidine kinase [Streptomyces olivaceoviridis]GGY68870.1 histidine kinase [Streptomyces olivaceoviridis]
MSTNQVDAPARHAPTRGGARGFADRWPFRRKLNLLVGIPLAVIAVLLAYLFTDLVRQSSSAGSAARMVRDSAQVARLVDRVEAEHQQAILLSTRYESGDAKPTTSAYRAAQRAVDSQVATVREAFGDRLPESEAQALRGVEGLTSLRTSVEQSYLPADNIDPAYAGAAQSLIDGLGLDRDADLAETFTGSLLDSLLRADAAHGAFETNVFAATTGDTNAQIEFTSAVGAYEVYTHQAARFARFATEAQAERFSGIEHTRAQREIAEAYAELQVGVGRLETNDKGRLRQAVQDALTDYPAYPEQAAARLKITTALIGQIADRADGAADSARWRAGLLLSGALIAFALWIAFAVLVRRSVVRPVQALTGAAREVAEVAGRELARVADDDAEDDGPPRLRDMPVTARDEIGDLAEAFNRVQTTAAALLERQVLSRRNTAEMFGNVGRRVSNLTTRQLALIDAVERGETDPALLERLYSIDHIAVRLRRNADSLMLLAGIRETVLDAGPTALSTVVRAALGQIEGYQRVRLYAASDALVEPDIIGDLTLMVAELLENAVSFSPEGSPVEVTVRSGAEGTHVVVTDHGLGMSAERLAEENARLIRRERLDLVPTKVLGLFVVGALARRWEIGVELTRTPGGGVTAEVTLPASLLLAPGAGSQAPVAAAPAPVAGASGPVPARGALPPDTAHEKAPADGTAPDEPVRAEHGGPLPRRIPRRAPQGTGTQAPSGEQTRGDAEQTARPLRRRVRGATLRTTAGAAPTVPKTVRPLDAEAVRDALEEFEDAVERARRDSDTGSFARPASTGTAPRESGTATATREDAVPTAAHRPRPDGAAGAARPSHPDATGEATRPSHPEDAPPHADDTPATDPPPHPSPERPTPAATAPTPPATPPHDPNHLPEGAEQ